MNATITRQSNMELLRVISMILILMIHADFYSIPYSIPRWFVVEGADAGVNCFVLISGYFGIHPKTKGFLSLLFQILFFIAVGNLIVHIGGGNNYLSFNLLKLNWFINSYIALYVFAPILNTFAENATRKSFIRLIVLWSIIEFCLGYTVDYLKFERGYSFQAFILLYMIARFIRIHGGRIFTLNKKFDLLLYILFTLMSSFMISLCEHIGKETGGLYYFRAYNSPLMIMASISLMLFFSKLEFQSKTINWLGKSAYAAFLLHCVVYDWYRSTHHTFYLNNNWVVASIYSLVFIATLFTAAILLDQVRILIWNRGTKVIEFVIYQLKLKFKITNNENLNNNHKL